MDMLRKRLKGRESDGEDFGERHKIKRKCKSNTNSSNSDGTPKTLFRKKSRTTINDPESENDAMTSHSGEDISSLSQTEADIEDNQSSSDDTEMPLGINLVRRRRKPPRANKKSTDHIVTCNTESGKGDMKVVNLLKAIIGVM